MLKFCTNTFIIILEYYNIVWRCNILADLISQMSSSLLKSLAHPTRLQILERLRNEDELCVCDIYEYLGLEQSNVSQHLKILKDQNILASRKDGLKVMYSVKYPDIYKVLNIIKKILVSQLNEIQDQLID